MKRTSKRISFLILFSLFSVGISWAQVTTGTPPFGSFGGGPFDTVNLGNLNVHFAIPVLHKAGRGMPFAYDLTYDSSEWYPVGVSGSQSWFPSSPTWGWQGTTQATLINMQYSTTYNSGICGIHNQFTWQSWTFSNFSYKDTSGTTHKYPYSPSYVQSNGTDGACPPTGPQPAVANPVPAPDSSGYSLIAIPSAGSATTYLASSNGTTLKLANITDANGNVLSTSGNTYTDTLGQTAITLSGAGTPTSPIVITYTAPGGAAQYTVSYGSYTVQTHFGCSGVLDYYASSVPLVNSVALADDTPSHPDRYTFTYEGTLGPGYSGDVTGRIASITLPTGGTITYAYTGGSGDLNHNAITCSDGSTAGLTRTLSPTTGTNYQWTYSRTNPSGSTWYTTVTDPTTAANQTVIYFQKDSALNPTSNYYETQRQSFQGPTTGTLLNTVVTCYNGNGISSPWASCATTGVASPISRLTKFTFLHNSSGLESETDSTLDAFGLIHEVDEYDYATAAVGSLLRKTITNYAVLGNGIADRPLNVEVRDGSNNRQAYTSYNFDAGAITTTSGTPQHVSVSGSRGNLTMVATQVNGTAYLYRTFAYYDTGMLKTSTDVGTSGGNGALTTYNYAPGSASCFNSFVTSITEPLSLSRSMTWDCNGGVSLSLTDENGNMSSTAYAGGNYTNLFWRPYSSTDQSGNTTAFAYPIPASPNPNQTESTLSFNSLESAADVLTTLDGLGHTIFSQTRQTPGGSTFDTVATCYDPSGHTSFASLPYSASAATPTTSCPSATVPGTSTTYDGLGRLASVTDGGGGSTTFSYPANDVYQTHGPTPTTNKQLEYDALGRLSSVCEITNASGSGTCAQKSSPQPTGFYTTYAYDALNDLTAVAQNSQSSPSQNRTLVYDMLGRLVSEKNPEANGVAKTYAYDTDATCGTFAGDLIKRTDAAGNVTCNSYDVLHRVTGITYPAGPNASVTPAKYFQYDTPYSGSTGTNIKGRLVAALTCQSPTSCAGNSVTSEEFGYSARGEVTDLWERTSHSGSTYHTNATYWPNGTLNQLSGIPSVPATIYGWYGGAGPGLDGEGRVTRVSPSGPYTDLVPFQGVSYNAASQVTNVTYGSADNDVFQYDPNTGRMNKYAYNVGAAPQSVVGNLTWNPNGTLQQLAITDPLNAANTQTCNYGYDDLSRILTNSCGSAWNQNFTIDPFGNTKKSGSLSFTPIYDQTTNRISSLSGCTILYDADGNPLNDCARGTQDTYTWDADGHAVTLDGNTVVYDALGRAVETYATVSPSFYGPIIYSPMGQKVAMVSVSSGTTNLDRAYVPLPGGGTAVYGLVSGSPALMFFWHADWLGTARLGTTPARGLYLDRAYAPYGENYANSGATGDLSFTGKSQDLVSSTYDFPFRNYSAISGRWYSPDPAGMAAVNPADPQTWNRYAYVGNRPLNRIDPLGLDEGCDPFTDPLCGGGVCPPEYETCDPDPCDNPFACDPVEGGDNPGPPSHVHIYPQRTGGVWPNNETLGLPPGINFPALTLGNLLGLNPNGPCDFGVCAPIGNSLTPAAAGVGGIGETICIFAEPCGLAELIGFGAAAAVVVFAPQIIHAAQDIGQDVECAAEWAEARSYCAELYSQPPASRPSHWGGSYDRCVRGQVSERCGGNPIDWGGK